MIQLLCEQCGISYTTKPYMATKSFRHFCGFTCYGAWQKTHRVGMGRKRILVSCYTCGKDLERQPSAIQQRNFCSRKCLGIWRSSEDWTGTNNPSWLGGHAANRGPNWDRQRRAARTRDNDTCQRCGIMAVNLPVHHLKPFRLFDDYRDANVLENLMTLCPPCHGIIEQTFWATHPELADLSPFPMILPLQPCRACGQDFTPGSGAAAVCDMCCMATCAYCQHVFFSRRAAHRSIKYCSRDCRHAAVAVHRTRVCSGCGQVFRPARKSAHYCSHHCRMTTANPRRQFFARRKLAAQETNRDEDDT